MSLLDAFALEPFSVNESLLDSLLLEPDSFEVWIGMRNGINAGTGTPDGRPALAYRTQAKSVNELTTDVDLILLKSI